jgi:hypothetical protein
MIYVPYIEQYGDFVSATEVQKTQFQQVTFSNKYPK